jgi:tetrapyrrole methylase family protein/MazG family protein
MWPKPYSTGRLTDSKPQIINKLLYLLIVSSALLKGINMKNYLKEFEKLVGIMAKLRSKNGCMWDKEQTHESLVKYLIEESGEVKKAVRKKDMKNLEEELGDILLQVVFHAQIGKENKTFDIAGVISALNKKLIRRHPHVFGNYKVNNTTDIEIMWKKVKAKEKGLKKDA